MRCISGSLSSSTKSVFASRKQHTVGLHGDAGIALRIRHQRLLAEGIARLQFGELDSSGPATDVSPDMAAADFR
jgi:hypothetical protein